MPQNGKISQRRLLLVQVRPKIPEHGVHAIQRMASTDSGVPEKWTPCDWNTWSAWPGTGGRHPSESPVGMARITQLIPQEGRLAMQDLYERAVDAYGTERITAQGLLDLVGRCVSEGRFGYAAGAAALVQVGAWPVAMEGYVGPPELPPPDTRLIRLRGAVSPMEMANVMKTAINLSRLSAESNITLDLKLELKGDVNDHSVQMALREIQQRVVGLAVEDVRGE